MAGNAGVAVLGGRAYYDQALPCYSTTLVKFRALLGEEGVQELAMVIENYPIESGVSQKAKIKQQHIHSPRKAIGCNQNQNTLGQHGLVSS